MSGPILVTGHTGFKGTWLTLLLEELGVEVVGYSLKAESDSLYERLSREGKIRETFSDICDKSSLAKFISKVSPAAIIHLAAQPLVLKSYIEPLKTFETNVLGTANLLDESLNWSSIRSVIVATTDKVYRNFEDGKKFIESDPLQGKDPYSNSKVGTEAVISAWQEIAAADSHPIISSVRAGNVIGGGDFAQARIFPDLIRGMMSKSQIQIRNGLSTRPWQHVLDPLMGYVLTLNKTLQGQKILSLNFGPNGESLSVAELIEIANKVLGMSLRIKFDEAKKYPKEAVFLALDSSKAQKELGWFPAWTQRESIESTSRWWKSVLVDGGNPYTECKKDIEHLLKSYSGLKNE